YVIMARLSEGELWFLKDGLKVDAETSSYPYSRFGYLKGKVKWISTVVNPHASGDGSVTLCIELKKPKRDDVTLKPGMTSTVWIRAGKTRLLWRILPFRVFDMVD
ncbi:MAG: hypothetical protein J7M14_02935, partial [Planctomycetes bacterium]|nr:hypothetical protein [Planctomycetota bacterium]